MFTTEVEIANSALTKVGADRIISLNDNTKGAKVCKERYPKLRDYLLRAHLWNFAVRRIELAVSVTTPVFEWDFAYPIPVNCLRVLKTNHMEPFASTGDFNTGRSPLGASGGSSEWKLEGRDILSNDSEMKIMYIERVTDVTQFDTMFPEVVALLLASDIAYFMSGSVTLAAAILSEYKLQLAQARSFDGQEGYSENQIIASSWITSRISG